MAAERFEIMQWEKNEPNGQVSQKANETEIQSDHERKFEYEILQVPKMICRWRRRCQEQQKSPMEIRKAKKNETTAPRKMIL